MDLLQRKDTEELLTNAMKRITALNRFGSYPDVYGRMAWEKPAPTIKRECSHVGNGRYVHPEQDRLCSTDDGETIFNTMRLANVGVKKGDEISVFMLGKGVLFEQAGNEQFDVMGQVNQFGGDFYV